MQAQVVSVASEGRVKCAAEEGCLFMTMALHKKVMCESMKATVM